MNEDRMNPESKRLSEVFRQRQELTYKSRDQIDPPEIRERYERYREQVLRRVIARSHPDKSVAWREARLQQLLGKTVTKEPKRNRKEQSAAEVKDAPERKSLPLSVVRKNYEAANEVLISRIKGYRFARVHGIEVR